VPTSSAYSSQRSWNRKRKASIRFGNVSSTAGGVSERNSDLSDPDIESIKQVDIHGDATVPPVVSMTNQGRQCGRTCGRT
jgi:hypothetical protein